MRYSEITENTNNFLNYHIISGFRILTVAKLTSGELYSFLIQTRKLKVLLIRKRENLFKDNDIESNPHTTTKNCM